MLNKLHSLLGASPALSQPAPHYQLITDGLVVAERRAQAWFDLAPTSTQMNTSEESDVQLYLAIAAAKRVLADYTCQIKIVWSLTESTEYVEDAQDFTLPQAMEWAWSRAQSIDSWALPKRHVLLGVDLEERTDPLIVRAINQAASWVNSDVRSVPKSEIAYLEKKMRTIGANLERSIFHATPAPLETLAWMIGRESHRQTTALPKARTLTGATLAALSAGRIVPWRDHLRIYAHSGQECAYAAMLAFTAFPEEMDTNSGGAWLLECSNITRGDVEDPTRIVDVLPEASVRFHFNSPAQALKQVEKVRQSAKEQRREAAKTSAEETSLDVAMSEAEMVELASQIRRGTCELVSFWPILTITEATLPELHASVEATINHYANLGISVELLSDQQGEAWASTLPCDLARIIDYYHVCDAQAFFGSQFWGASIVGEPNGPAIGYTTGATRQIVRFNPTSHPLLGDSATTLVTGRSGRGKTTALQLFALDAAAQGAWVCVIDYKGDLNNDEGGLVAAAHSMGINARRIDMGENQAGTCDLLRVMDEEDALIYAHSQLMLLISQSLCQQADPILKDAITSLIRSGQARSTAALIRQLEESPDETSRRVARELASMEHDSLGRLIVGEAGGGVHLDGAPGIHLLQFPKIDLPDASLPFEQWSLAHKISAAIARGVLAWINALSRDSSMRHLRKLVLVPEAHLFTANSEAASFLVRVARMGRAYHLAQVLDSQDPSSLAAYEGIIEQVTTAFCFSQNTPSQQDAAAMLLGLNPSSMTRAAIGTVSVDADGQVRHGHCLMRDRLGQVATVQIAIPTRQVAAMLSTTPQQVEERG